MAEGYTAGDACAACRGQCCRTTGCSLSPEDMCRELAGRPVNVETVEELLQKGNFSIDSFQIGGRAFYYLRMRHKCFTFIGVDAMGECVMLTDSGCALAFENRPMGGRMLEGKAGGGCIQHYTREMMVEDWKPYQELLRTIWDRWHDRMEADGVFDRCEEAYMLFQRERKLVPKFTG
ncbi:MAG: hypothetical protein HFI57_11410 [Lachnospiraceae bacterium]|nr:hypothetical protein [Lachnospiraceae bacterium]